MLLKLENVKKKYKNFELNCSLSLEKGKITGLIGPNGAGKSTTFKAILNLLSIDGGIIEVFGQDSKKLTSKHREDIGVVLSDSGFSGYLKVKDIIPVMDAMYSKFDKENFKKQCEHFSIPMDKKIKEFSTGMKAKLKLLIAMSHEAKLLILDEPTSGLDVIVRDEILDMLRNFMENEERSILISSHISSDLENLCDDIYMIDKGKIVLHEDTDIILSEYGVLKLTQKQYSSIDKTHILKTKEDKFGYCCLTNQKQFYLENYPDIIAEKGNIDEVIVLMINGKEEV